MPDIYSFWADNISYPLYSFRDELQSSCYIRILKQKCAAHQGPVVQSVVSLLVVKILTVLVSTISNSQVLLLKKCEELLQMQKLLTFFQQKY